MKTKQVIVINRGTTPPMRRGKEITQGAHASMAWLTGRFTEPDDDTGDWSYWQVELSDAEVAWLKGGYRKITCQVPGEDELMALYWDAKNAGLTVQLVTDAGLTEFPGETVTALAIGPDYDEKIDAVTGDLKLY